MRAVQILAEHRTDWCLRFSQRGSARSARAAAS